MDMPKLQKSEKERIYGAGFSRFDVGADSLEELITPQLLSYLRLRPDTDLYITSGAKVGSNKRYELYCRSND
jgi:hypothetical protein